jgi:hypothetical protein
MMVSRKKTVSVMNDVEFTLPRKPQIVPSGHEKRQRIEKLTSYAASEFV